MCNKRFFGGRNRETEGILDVFQGFSVHARRKRSDAQRQAFFAFAIEQKKRIPKYPHTRTFPKKEGGILTVLPCAYGEADTLPSLLPAYRTTGFAGCQDFFS